MGCSFLGDDIPFLVDGQLVLASDWVYLGSWYIGKVVDPDRNYVVTSFMTWGLSSLDSADLWFPCTMDFSNTLMQASLVVLLSG